MPASVCRSKTLDNPPSLPNLQISRNSSLRFTFSSINSTPPSRRRMSGRNSHGKRSYSHSDYDNSGSKRRNSGEDKQSVAAGSEDTIYRYICPIRKIGSIIGRGGDIVKQLRNDTKAKIRIGDTIEGCDDRVVTIYSPSDETNPFEDSGNYISPAQDALFRVHDRVVDSDMHGDEESEGSRQVTARLLVPSDQIGCIIGKGGQIVQNIRTETGAQIRIMKDDNLPRCALNSDELVQISGDASLVKKALYQIASRLHDNPSRSQNMLTSASSVSAYPSGGSYAAPSTGAPMMGPLHSLVGPYGGYRSDAGDWSRSYFPVPRNDMSSKEFSLRLVCRTANIGSVIGKGGTIINQIRQESGAGIKVDNSSEGEDTLITISAKEYFEDISPATEAAVRLQPRCSDKSERDSGIVSFTTRMLVPSSRIGCLIGKGGSIITEMRKLTKANIRIVPKENLPKIALEDDEMVQISADLDVARDALIQIITRLRANLFDREGTVSTFLPVLPYLPGPPDNSDVSRYDSRDRDRDRDSKRHGRGGQSYPDPYGSSGDLHMADRYGSYGSPPQIGGARGSTYGGYGSSYAPGGRNDSSSYVDRVSTQGPVSRRRSYY
uniref:K Homology domain-containing protein n=1 Tax=Kalanchoe fedtschenkoi TaxID=63787 RepID=A0A7N0V215_KALFE